MNTCSDVLTLLACQVSVPEIRSKQAMSAHVDGLIAKVSSHLEAKSNTQQSNAQGSALADLVVLPELSFVEYSRESFELLADLAEPLEGSSTEKMSLLAQQFQTTIVFGMPRISGGRYFISQIVVDPSGEVIGCYDKLHICQYGASMEKEFFERGNHLAYFDIGGVRFATIVCYDIRIPELSRTLVIEHSVDCLLHCGAYFRDESFSTWHSFATTRAMENQVYLLSLNRAGADYGDSVFCPPWIDDERGMTRFKEFEEDFQYVTIHRSEILRARSEYTFLKDRLQNYQSLPLWRE